jgi:hypothetical protein
MRLAKLGASSTNVLVSLLQYSVWGARLRRVSMSNRSRVLYGCRPSKWRGAQDPRVSTRATDFLLFVLWVDRSRAALKSLLEGLDLAARCASGNEVEGALTVYSTPEFSTSWLMPRIGRFYERYVDVEINFLTATTSRPFGAEPADLSTVFGAPFWKGVNIHKLNSIEFFPVCSPVLFSKMSKPVRPSDLQNHVLGSPCPSGGRPETLLASRWRS